MTDRKPESPSTEAVRAIQKIYNESVPACQREAEELYKERTLSNHQIIMLMIGHMLRFDDQEVDVESVILGIEEGFRYMRCLYRNGEICLSE